MNPTNKMPLFIISGASGVGKSTISEILFKNEEKYIVLESDLLWDNRSNTPENNYREYRELWLRLCKNIAQIGLPVVLCRCAVPKDFEVCEERKNLSAIHYIAIVSDEETLITRMKKGRNIEEDDWIKSSVEFNNWLINNASTTVPQMAVLDYTNSTAEEAAKDVDAWISKCVECA